MKKFIVILVAIISLGSSLFVLKGEEQWSGKSSAMVLPVNINSKNRICN